MIRNFRITYDNFETPLQLWQFQNPFLHEFAVAALTTVLAYQTTSIFLDIFLGSKARGEVTLADLFILLRTEDSSLRFKAIRFFLKKIFGILDWKPIHPDKSRKLGAGYRPILKLCLLLLLIPTVNVVCVSLTLERDVVMSFRDARFGGMSAGSRADIGSFTTQSDNQTGQCFPYSIDHGSRDLPLVEIFFCTTIDDPRDIKLDNVTTKTVVVRSREGDIVVGMSSPNFSLFVRSYLMIWTAGKSFRVKPTLTSEEASRIVRDGAKRILQLCPNSSTEDSQPQLFSLESDVHEESFTVFQHFLCNVTSRVHGEIIATVIEMERYIGPVNSETLEFAETSDASDPTSQILFESGDNLPFLRRRSPYVCFSSLLMATVFVCFIRLIVKLATNNDIHLGIELILKRYADIYCCDSMLQNQSVIHYTDS